MNLPIAISVPHAGLSIPEEVVDLQILTEDEIRKDGDEGAAAIYAIAEEVDTFVTTPIARAFVDMNRAEGDLRPDGVVKTHTCWDEPVYRAPLADALVETLMECYHRPYHRALTEFAGKQVPVAIDCHTMAAFGPPIGPDPGKERPWVCLSDAGFTCPPEWTQELADCLTRSFGKETAINTPFRGGHIVRSHASEMPWLQLELSRAPFFSGSEKRERVLDALRDWCASMQF